MLRRLDVRVLFADADTAGANAARSRAVEADLAAGSAVTVLRPAPGESLAEAVSRLAPDVVIVDMARPDRDGLDGIRQVSAQNPHPIVMFVDEDDPVFMEAAISAGVSSYNVVGASLPDVKPIVKAAVALFQRYRRIEEDLRSAEKALHERAAIDRAKSLLMRQRKLSEPEAYRWLRSRAMDRGRRIAEIAEDVLAREAPGEKS